MGSLRRKTWNKPLPPGAELFNRKGERFAKWRDGKGKTRTAPVTTAGDGTPRIVATSRKWLAKYRDGAGLLVEVPTGCADKAAAEQRLAELERQAERVRCGTLTPGEGRALSHLQTPAADHLEAYRRAMVANDRDGRYIVNTMGQLRRLFTECGFRLMRDLRAEPVVRWLEKARAAGLSARTRNSYRVDLLTFAGWCVAHDRLPSNPFTRLPVADERTDRRRQRRALTEAELVRLLDVARRRPLLDAMTVRRGKHRGEAVAELRPETVARLELLGRERALVYKTLVLTGLRKGELASLTVGQLDLDADPAFLTLDAADEKNREGNSVPLRSDLAADVRQWLNDKATARQDAARNAPTVAFDSKDQEPPECIARHSGGRKWARYQEWSTLPADTLVFTVPAGLVRILDRDLKAAGIPKTDDRGRTVDVHALRHYADCRIMPTRLRHPRLLTAIPEGPSIADAA
jgi:integrase